MVGRLNQTMRGERGRETKRGASDQERQPGPREDIAKMTDLVGVRLEEGKWKPSPWEGEV